MATYQRIVPKKSVYAFKEEATLGTAPTDAAADACLPEIGATLAGTNIDWQDDNTQTGGLGHFHPHDGGPLDPGETVTFKVRGKGSGSGAPEIGPHLECSFGPETTGVIGDADASPLTTTSLALATGTAAVGQLMDVDLTGGTETRRVITESSGTVTLWPPLSLAPAENDVVWPGISYLLSSTHSDYKSGSAFWYLPNGQKMVLSGLRGNVVFTVQRNQPLMAEFTMTGIKTPVVAPAAIGYTPSPVGWGYSYPMCRGIFLKSYIPVITTGTPTTTVIEILKADGSAGDFTFYGTDEGAVDKFIVDVGSSVYETRAIKTFDYSAQQITLGSALGSAPAASLNGYIEHQTCLPDTLTFDAGHVWTKVDCAQSTDGWADQELTDRMVAVDWSEYFFDFMEYNILANAAFTELWAIIGSTRYNKIAICAPNVFRQDYSLDLGGDFGMVNISGNSYQNTMAGNDELYLTFL